MNSPVEMKYATVWEGLRDIFVQQRTGRLVCSLESERQTLFALSGQLYLAGSNPSRDRLEAVLTAPPGSEEDPRFDPRRYLAGALAALVDELGTALAGWKARTVRFQEGLGEAPDDLVGPVPTAELVMDLATRGCDLEEILRRLGGPDASFRAVADHRFRRRVPHLDHDDLALLERLHKRDSVRSLLAGTPQPQPLARRVARLHAVGLLERVSEPGRAASSIPREVLERLSERVDRDLDDRPIDLDATEHRVRLLELLGDYGRLGFYELLGVSGDASTEEIHGAYMRKARLAHPRHAAVLGLGRADRKLEWLSARLTEAYLVLSDPARAAEYRRGGGVVPMLEPAGGEAADRQAERAELARECYRAALDYVEAEDYFYAIEMLRQALLNNRRPEYYTLLGHCQMQNPRWLHLAVDSFRRALAMSPDDEQLRLQFADALELYRRQGDLPPATGGDRESRDARRARRAVARLQASRK